MKKTQQPGLNVLFGSCRTLQLLSVCMWTAAFLGIGLFSPGAQARSKSSALTIDNYVTGAKVSCAADAGACPSAVGMLVAQTHGKLVECTAFLVSDHVMLTNSHCIPVEIKRAGSDCSQKIRVIFPRAEGRPAETLSCARILKASEITSRDDAEFAQKPDYAAFTLKHPTRRKPMELSREGLNQHLKLTAFAIDPLATNNLEGILKVKTCTAQQNSVVAPAFTHDHAAVGVFNKCGFTSGNSGSPALDSQGRVRAIVHATLSERQRVSISANTLQHLDDMGYMTNASCLDLPGAAGPAAGGPNRLCRQRGSTRDGLVHVAFTHADDHRLERLAHHWLQTDRQKAFIFKIDPADVAAHVVMPQVQCIQNPAIWRPRNSRDLTTVSARLPIWGFMPVLDSTYHLQLVPQQIDELEVLLSFRSSSLKRNGYVSARAVTTEKLTHKTDINPHFHLVECPDPG